MLKMYPAHLGTNTYQIAGALGSYHSAVANARRVKALDALTQEFRPEDRTNLWTMLTYQHMSPYNRESVRALFDERYRIWRNDGRSLVDLALSRTPVGPDWSASSSAFLRPTFMDFVQQNGVGLVREVELAKRMLALISVKALDFPQAHNALSVLSRTAWADLRVSEFSLLHAALASQQLPQVEGPRIGNLVTLILEREQELGKQRGWPVPDLIGDNAPLMGFTPFWGESLEIRNAVTGPDPLVECLDEQGMFTLTEAFRVSGWAGSVNVVAWRPVQADTIPWLGVEELGASRPEATVRSWEGGSMLRPRADVLLRRTLESGGTVQWLPARYAKPLNLRPAPEYRPLALSDVAAHCKMASTSYSAFGGFQSMDLMSRVVSMGPSPNGADIAGWIVGLTTYLDHEFDARGWARDTDYRARREAIWLLVQAVTLRTPTVRLGAWASPGDVPAGKVMLSEWLDANFAAYKAATDAGRSPALEQLVM